MSTAVATPTAMNTFNNTYDLTHRPTPIPFFTAGKISHPPRSQSSRRTDRSQHIQYGVKSILKNSELPSYATISPLTGSRKVLFPQPKKVCFRADLEEEIVTKVFTAKHSDLTWEDDETDVVESVEQVDDQGEDNSMPTTKMSRSIHKSRRDSGVFLTLSEVTKTKPRSKAGRQSSAGPSTRRKRRWEWTLSPVHSSHKDVELDTSDLDSDWVVVCVSQSEGNSDEASSRPSKRRAASIDAPSDGSIDRPRPVWVRKRASTL